MNFKLLPGTQFPSVVVTTTENKEVDLVSTGNYKLVVVYRGQFCPFCKATLTKVSNRLDDLAKGGIPEVIAVSADPVDLTRDFFKENGFKMQVGCGLTVAQMRTLGLYVSSPTHYIEQDFDFSEPAWFLLNPDNTIRYIDIASAPFAGRPNIDDLLDGFGWVLEQLVEDPNHHKVMWGSK